MLKTFKKRFIIFDKRDLHYPDFIPYRIKSLTAINMSMSDILTF